MIVEKYSYCRWERLLNGSGILGTRREGNMGGDLGGYGWAREDIWLRIGEYVCCQLSKSCEFIAKGNDYLWGVGGGELFPQIFLTSCLSVCF